jgi:hypothetical protein
MFAASSAAKGFGIEWRGVGRARRLVAFDPVTGDAVASATTWTDILPGLLRAPRRLTPTAVT